MGTCLYKIDIQTDASPSEVAEFCETLEDEGYEVLTDMSHGRLEVHSTAGGDE